MDKAILVGPDIEAGKELIRALDASRFDVRAAFWFYREDSEEWRLYIATPIVKERSSREAYSKILEVLKKNGIRSIGLSQISAIDTSNGLVTVLRLVTDTGPALTDLSISGNSIDGVYIRAAIYRMNVQ